MPFVIKIIADAAFGNVKESGQYVKQFDFEARQGRGDLFCVPNKKDAKLFGTMPEAMEYYRTQSKTQPLRPDFLPNRPLTAFTVEIVAV